MAGLNPEPHADPTRALIIRIASGGVVRGAAEAANDMGLVLKVALNPVGVARDDRVAVLPFPQREIPFVSIAASNLRYDPFSKISDTLLLWSSVASLLQVHDSILRNQYCL